MKHFQLPRSPINNNINKVGRREVGGEMNACAVHKSERGGRMQKEGTKRERETETDRQTDRQRQRETVTETHTET